MFKLQQENKYSKKLYKCPNCLINNSKKIIILICSTVLLSDFSNTFIRYMNRKRQLNSVNFDINIDNKSVTMNNDEIINFINNNYNDLKNSNKSSFIVSLISSKVKNNNSFNKDEKNEIINISSKLIYDWGYLYEKESLLKISKVVDDITVDDIENFSNGYISGAYNYISNIILLKDNSYGYISHEFEHAITTGNTHKLKYSYFIREAMDSSSDYEYADINSYNNLMRNQILFLGIITGREKLIKSYLNCDDEYLKNIIEKDNLDLLDMFEEELDFYNEHNYIDDVIAENIRQKLKKMYEEKYNCSITTDKVANTLYMACIPYSSYKTLSTIFTKSDYFSYSHNGTIEYINLNEDLNYHKKAKSRIRK